MSLLLDALNRASKDKVAAALAQAPSLPKPDEPTLTSPVPASEPAATRPPIRLEPASTMPVLELSLSAKTEPVAPVDAWHTEKAVATPDKVLLQPFVVTESGQPSKLPVSPSEQASTASQNSAAAASESKPAPQAAPRVAQEIVRAKEPASRARPPMRLVILGSLVVLLAAGLGSMLMGWWGDPSTWFQVSRVQGPAIGAPAVLTKAAPVGVAPAAPDPAMVPAGVVGVAQTQAAAPTVVNPSAVPAASAQPTARRAAEQAAAKPMRRSADEAEVVCAPGTSLADCPSSRLASSTAAAKAGQAVFQSRTAGPSALELGYAALVQGRLQESAQAYGQALRANPEERDALLGLAYISHQQGRVEEARGYYQRVLRQDPGNPVARSGLLAVTAVDDPQVVASRSREVAEQNPDSAAAQSALGHAMVREGRLADAQQLFYRAHLLEPGVAQHAFNLAVALDRLHKFGPARLYYERALVLSAQSGGERSSGVPQSVVQSRLEQLRAASLAKPDGVAHE